VILMPKYTATVDAKYSFEFVIKARDRREARKKAVAKFKRKMNQRNLNIYLDLDDWDLNE